MQSSSSALLSSSDPAAVPPDVDDSPTSGPFSGVAIPLPDVPREPPAAAEAPPPDPVGPRYLQILTPSEPGEPVSYILRIPNTTGANPPQDITDALHAHARRGATTAACREREYLAVIGPRFGHLAHPVYPSPHFLPEPVFKEGKASWIKLKTELSDFSRQVAGALAEYRNSGQVTAAQFGKEPVSKWLKGLEAKVKELVTEAEVRYGDYLRIPRGLPVRGPFDPIRDEDDAVDEISRARLQTHPIVFSEFYRLLPCAPPASLHDLLSRGEWSRAETAAATEREHIEYRNSGEDASGFYDWNGARPGGPGTDEEVRRGLAAFPAVFPSWVAPVPDVEDRLARHISALEIGSSPFVQPGGPPGEVFPRRHFEDSPLRPAKISLQGSEALLESSPIGPARAIRDGAYGVDQSSRVDQVPGSCFELPPPSRNVPRSPATSLEVIIANRFRDGSLSPEFLDSLIDDFARSRREAERRGKSKLEESPPVGPRPSTSGGSSDDGC